MAAAVNEISEQYDDGGDGGASAVKEPGHFEVRKSSSQVTLSQVFSAVRLFLKKVDDLF